MKYLKKVSYSVLTFIFLFSAFQCAISQKLEKEPPTDFQDVYYENWVAGIRGGGSGTNLFITVKNKTVVLDSVYFRGKVTKLLNEKRNKALFIGRFNSTNNTQKDMVISLNSNEETNKKVAQKTPKIPFKLKDNECVIMYQKDNKTHYYKVSNVREQKTEYYPSVRPN